MQPDKTSVIAISSKQHISPSASNYGFYTKPEKKNKAIDYLLSNSGKRKNNKYIVGISVFCFVIFLSIILLFISQFPFFNNAKVQNNSLDNISEKEQIFEEFIMQDFSHINYLDAENILRNYNFFNIVETITTSPKKNGMIENFNEGDVVYTKPGPGTTIKEGYKIELIIYRTFENAFSNKNANYSQSTDDAIFEIRILEAGNNVRIRSTPTTSVDDNKIGSAKSGEIFPVYETIENDGYVWYRVGINMWIADSGEWTERLNQ